VLQGLDGSLSVLRDGGRLAVISFHSLEDRPVKRFFRGHEGRWIALEAGGERWEGELPPVRRINRKAVLPHKSEYLKNARSRSAKLRVAERLAAPYKRKGK